MSISFTAAQLESAADAVADLTGNEVELRLDYSGRGMYGRTCVGVVDRNGAAATLFLIKLAEQAVEADKDSFYLDTLLEWVAEAMEGQSRDSMGYDVITYWTRLSCSDPEDAREGEDG
ncbi:hypothetical protein ACWEQ4_00825 [Rhodococcus sp. NPDC003994]